MSGRIHIPAQHAREILQRVPGLARFACLGEAREHFECIEQIAARKARPVKLPYADRWQRRSHHRARQRDKPAQVHPQQEHRHRRKRAVHCRISRNAPDVIAEAAFRQFERNGRAHAAHYRIAPLHPAIRQIHVEHCESERRERQRRAGQRPIDHRRDVLRGAERHRACEQIRRNRQANADQNRSQRDDGPIDQHALREGSRLAHPPDHIERRFDGHHRHHRGDEQDDHAHRRQAFGLGRELVQVFENLVVDLRRHQMVGQKTL